MQKIANLISISILIMLLNFLFGCRSTDNTSAEEQSRISTFGENYTAAWNSQKPENVAAFFSTDGSLSVNNQPPLEGRDAIKKFTEGFMIAFPDLKLVMDSLIIKPDVTEYYWTFSGTNAGPSGTCNFVKFSGVERWQFDESGLIKFSKGNYDEQEYKHQVEFGIEE